MPNSHTLDQNLQRLITARTSIANAIVQKGGTVSQGDGFEDFPDDIASITNTYTQADEGKVVSNGALVAQTAYPSEITSNNAYDTTNYSSVTVNVPAGGPEEIIGIAKASPWQLTATGSVKQIDRFLIVDLAFKNTSSSSGYTGSPGNAICTITNLQLDGLSFSRQWYGASSSSGQFFFATISQNSTSTSVMLTMESSKSWYSGDTYYLRMLYEYVHT